MTAVPELPLARVEPAPRAGWSRLLPLLALGLALFLLREVWRARGPLVHVQALDGHGLRAGDPLRHRGIQVGEVTAVELTPRADGVRIEVRLARSASALAAEGARFWIARPVLGVEGVRGLETALGTRYLAVLPGPADAAPSRAFVALEEPPLFAGEDEGALEIVLLAEERAGLARGAPVLYRGFAIGTLVSVALASDATGVEVRARIQGAYAELVRADSRFHHTRGLQLDLGLAGLKFSVDSLQALWLGGVTLATPTHPGARASTGQRFPLARAADEAWRAWRPALPVGGALLAEAQVPERTWARLVWKPRGWLARERSREGWLVLVEGELIGPADLLALPEEADPASLSLELGGRRLALVGAPTWSDGALARRPFPEASAAFAAEARRTLSAAEDLLAAGDPALAPMAISVAHLRAEGSAFEVTGGLPLDERWHGAPVAARADGRWVGILLVGKGAARVVPLPGP